MVPSEPLKAEARQHRTGLGLIYTHLHSATRSYTQLHSATLSYTQLHSATLTYTHLHSPTLTYTHLHSPTLTYTPKALHMCGAQPEMLRRATSASAGAMASLMVFGRFPRGLHSKKCLGQRLGWWCTIHRSSGVRESYHAPQTGKPS